MGLPDRPAAARCFEEKVGSAVEWRCISNLCTYLNNRAGVRRQRGSARSLERGRSARFWNYMVLPRCPSALSPPPLPQLPQPPSFAVCALLDGLSSATSGTAGGIEHHMGTCVSDVGRVLLGRCISVCERLGETEEGVQL